MLAFPSVLACGHVRDVLAWPILGKLHPIRGCLVYRLLLQL